MARRAASLLPLSPVSVSLLLVLLLQLLLAAVASADVQFGDNPYYYANWCDGMGAQSLQYLDDRDCAKKFPSHVDRDAACGTVFTDKGTGYYADTSDMSSVVVDRTSLQAYPSVQKVNMQVILVRRVQGSADNGAQDGIYYKYMASGTLDETPFETWSSSKIFAMANGASRLRETCGTQECGMDSSTQGKHGSTPLGDLSTIVCSYDETQGYSSNSLASYFNDVGWRERDYSLVHDWLAYNTAESLGGNYGEATPSDLGFTFTSTTDAGSMCTVDADPWVQTYENSLSAFSMAELTRRIVLHREVHEENRYPGAEWTDMQSLIHGADDSTLFPGLEWGGMNSDTSIFTQSGTNITDIEARSQGTWRIFSKLGAGYSSSRKVGEITNNAYACFPVVSASSGEALADVGGVEFIISTRGSVAYDTTLEQAEALVQAAVADVVGAILDGSLQ